MKRKTLVTIVLFIILLFSVFIAGKYIPYRKEVMAASIITVDNVSESEKSSNNPSTWDHIIGDQPNRLLIVGVNRQSKYNPVTSVTCNAEALTFLTSQDSRFSVGNSTTEVFYLKNPPVGACTIAVKHDGPSWMGYSGGAISLYNVDLANPFGSPPTYLPKTVGYSPNDHESIVSFTVPSTNASQFILGIASVNMTQLIEKPGTIRRWFGYGYNLDSDGSYGASKPGEEGSTALSWDVPNVFSSDRISLVGMAINSVSGQITTPTPTPEMVPDDIFFNFDILLHGIGKGGDNQNPISSGNLNPLHEKRSITIDIYNNLNNLVLSKTGEVNFASGPGNFVGRINMGNTLADGDYLVKIKSSQYLRKSIPGIVSVLGGKENTFSQIALVTGDINNDNIVNILDYNLLIGCYSDLSPAKQCEGITNTDLTDDGLVNQYDYNLFLRELASQGGE